MTIQADADAGLTIQFGRLADAIEAGTAARLERAEELAAGICPITLDPPQLSGTPGWLLNVPDLLGPRDGYAWDICQVVFNSFTAGSVAMYKGPGHSEDQKLRYNATAAGVLIYARKGQLLLKPPDRLEFVGSNITGLVTVSIDLIQVKMTRLGEYLR